MHLYGWLGAGPPSQMQAGQGQQYLEATNHGDPGYAGPRLVSPNGQFRLEMQPDGNLVIYGPGNAVLRSWGPRGGRVTFNIQPDGNLVLYQDGHAVWASDTNGRGTGGRVVMQDDGNLVLYFGNSPAWSSETNGGKVYDSESTLTKIAHTAEDIGSYATTVVSLVPGVGTGVSAALAAGIALAQGQSITDAVKNGIRDAIPGGAIATAGFDMAVKVASGENVGTAALETARAQLPPVAQKAFDIGLSVVAAAKHQQANPAIVAPSGQGHAALTNAVAQVIRNPPRAVDPPKRAVAMAPAPAPARAPLRALDPPKRVAATSPSHDVGFYKPYPKMGVAGVGSFWSSNAWRWFVVYENGTPTAQHGPLWLSDNDANVQSANLLASTQGRDGVGDVAQWNWDADARQWRQVGGGALGRAAGGP